MSTDAAEFDASSLTADVYGRRHDFPNVGTTTDVISHCPENLAMNKTQETVQRVGFRWRQHEELYAERLEESAREAGRTPSEQARELLKEVLTQSDHLEHALQALHQEVAQITYQLKSVDTIKEGLRTMHENIYELRDDLATCTLKLLVDAGRVDIDTAEAWMKEALDAE